MSARIQRFLTAEQVGGAWSTFDITELVKGWKQSTYPANAGFILVNSTETNKRCFLSSEYSTSSYRPYVVFEYDAAITVSPSDISLYEGSTLTLRAITQPSGQSVTWHSSNAEIASVDQSGVLTALKAGNVEITATFYDSDGVLHTGYADVTVLLASGVYYITNLNSGYYLNVKNGRIADGSAVNQNPKYADSAAETSKIREMWKISRVKGDKYSIRPMSKLDMGLHVTGTNVDIYGIGTTDSSSVISESALWTIEWQSTGYVFKKNGESSRTMQVENASTEAGESIVARTYVNNNNCHWSLSKIASPPSGVYLYDTAKKTVVTNRTETVNVGETKSLSDFNLVAIAYSGSSIDQTFTWSSSDSDIATVDGDGKITSVSAGKSTITGRACRNGTYYYINYAICVGWPMFFESLIGRSIISADKLDFTDDGFFLTTTPLCVILDRNGIKYLPVTPDYSEEWYVYDYFDDWYLFAVTNEMYVSYGLYKMREQESDSYDNNDPGVTVSFISLDTAKITNCINNPSNENKYALYQAVTKVTGPGSYESDDIITGYFSETASAGSYLIAEKSVAFFASCCTGNVITAPDNLVAMFDEIAEIDELLGNVFLDSDTRAALIQRKIDLQRVPAALEAINTSVGMTIFDFDCYALRVQDKDNLKLYEKQAILACFTANVTFNSFAAEVQFHAIAVNDPKSVFDCWYDAAIRADMAIGEEYESGFYDEYYNLNSSIVREQAEAHGEY